MGSGGGCLQGVWGEFWGSWPQGATSGGAPPQEVEALLGETRMLQGKLQSQEDDFRLQNSTLLRELAKVGVPASPGTPVPPPRVPHAIPGVPKTTLSLPVLP